MSKEPSTPDVDQPSSSRAPLLAKLLRGARDVDASVLLVAGVVVAAVHVLLVVSLADPYGAVLVFYGGATVLFGLAAFLRHGGARITAAGVWCLAAAIFVGFPALYYWSGQDAGRLARADTAAALAFWTTWVMYAAFWRQPRHVSQLDLDASTLRRSALGAVVAAAVLGGAGQVSNQLAEYLFFPVMGCLGLLAACLVLSGSVHPVNQLARLAGAGVLLLLLWETFFGGYGRLVLVAVALVPILLVSMRLARWWFKAVIAVSILPVMGYFVSSRQRLGDEHGKDLSGIGSVVEPFRDYARILDDYGRGLFEYGWGDTFLATAVFWMPRGLWPDKPVGFGAVLVDRFWPEMSGTGVSLAALSWGEWVHNFGVFGLLLMALFLGYGIRVLDGAIFSERLSGTMTSPKVLGLVAAVTVASQLPCLLWAGSYTFAERAVMSAGPLLVAAVLLVMVGRGKGGRVRLPAVVDPSPGQTDSQPARGRFSTSSRSHGVAAAESAEPSPREEQG